MVTDSVAPDAYEPFPGISRARVFVTDLDYAEKFVIAASVTRQSQFWAGSGPSIGKTISDVSATVSATQKVSVDTVVPSETHAACPCSSVCS